jgi:hypothetical protein
MSRGYRVWSYRRKKQLALVELAFLKSRRRRGESGRDMDVKEYRLRTEIMQANRAGVWIGN